MSSIKDQEECSICLDSKSESKHKEYITLECNHVFHAACIIQYFSMNNEHLCPICRHQSTLNFPLILNIPFNQIAVNDDDEIIDYNNTIVSRNQIRKYTLIITPIVILMSGFGFITYILVRLG